MATPSIPAKRPPLVEPGHTYGSVSDKITAIPFSGKFQKTWLVGLGIAFILATVLFHSIAYLVVKGTGIWGINVPVGWGFAIINFVWWIGIGHAGTLISAILLLMRQNWRNSINRLAEAMTLFAVACAGLFPLLHMGRPWLAHWMFPYPNTMGLMPQFRSPLVWDVFAVSTYGTVSLMFWYVGLLPDLAGMRDRAKSFVNKTLFGMLSMGWRGSAKHWQRYETAYLLLAGLATPLVVSVHTVVSFDFAVSIIPGWHTTIFPPYFVAGAIFSGFAMVITLTIPIRDFFKLGDFITRRHLDFMAKVMLGTGLIVAYGYMMETFMAWYSGSEYEGFAIFNRMTGPYATQYWALILCNVVIPQLLWFRKLRSNLILLWIISLVVNTGMWLERYIIIVTSLSQDFLPSSWEMYKPTMWDWSTYVGTIGLFLSLMFLFVRFVPMIPVFEVQLLLPKKEAKASSDGGE